MSIPPPSYVHPGPPPEHPERPEGVPDRPRDALPPWRWWMGGVGVLLGLSVPIVLGVIAGIVVAAAGGNGTDLPSGVLIALTYAQDVGFVVAALFVARLARRPRARDFGLVPTALVRAGGLLVAVYVGFYAFAGIWAKILDLHENDDGIPQQLGADNSSLALALVVVLVCVAAPVAEEFLFRGLLFTSLRASFGLWPAALVSGAVFGGIHAGSSPVGYLVPLAIFGVGLALLYTWTGSLYPCMALHAINNAIAFGVTQDWTWEIGVTVICAPIAAVSIAYGISRALGGPRVAPIALT
jgi:membrane protease YdiL (CAAX protease family)